MMATNISMRYFGKKVENKMDNSNKINNVFMAFASGVETKEMPSFKRYMGIAPVKILAVNPDKKEWEAIYNTERNDEPVYIGSQEIDGNNYATIKIDFIVATDEEKTGIDFKTKVSYFLRNQYRFNRDQTKVQVIDKYGRTCWVTKEQCQNHEIPMYSNGPANIDKDYRPCYVGEEDLTNFLKAYLNIPNVMKYVNEKWIMVDNPTDSEARLDNITKYFTGNVEEIKNAVKLQPNNMVQILFGIRTTDDNRQFQAPYIQMALKASVNDYTKLMKDVADRQANGAYPNTIFEVCALKEYVVKATNFDTPSEDVFNNAAKDPWTF